MQPLVSIIVPVYNVEEYIEKCLDSIKWQTYGNFEVLIVNDGSSDNSLNICNVYAKKDGRFKVYNQENQGVSAARNHGLDNVSGDYICFVDADDYISPIYIEILMRNMSSANADISICNFRFLGEFEQDIDSVTNVWTKEEAIRQWFQLNNIPACVCGEVYKWELISDLRYDQTYRLGEDQIYFFEALKRGNKIVYQDVKLYFYYQRPDSAMHKNFDARYWDCVRMAEYFLKEGEANFPNQIALFKKKEIFTYIVLFISGSKVKNVVSREILATVLPRIKESNTYQIVKYCSNYEKVKYCMCKYFPRITSYGIWIKEKLKERGR